ncbi:hypothetical protein EB796_002813 [Bugula neritina]|uniref:UPAR/Ly6 domain-containing protein qvr n=1 Tax=Bugula neritina TaxID=10212 RepID=A0A7J7KKQ3_BUGNE|nr:hypothetical protein EB796_002813 [Bugula neritina]
MFFIDVIDCYKCVGKANNSSCSDPFVREEKDINEVKVIPCNRGACLKRLLKSNGTPMIMRTCTNELDFKLPLVNNVCQKESDGFGYLCMCGRDLCNRAVTDLQHLHLYYSELSFHFLY